MAVNFEPSQKRQNSSAVLEECSLPARPVVFVEDELVSLPAGNWQVFHHSERRPPRGLEDSPADFGEVASINMLYVHLDGVANKERPGLKGDPNLSSRSNICLNYGGVEALYSVVNDSIPT